MIYDFVFRVGAAIIAVGAAYWVGYSRGESSAQSENERAALVQAAQNAQAIAEITNEYKNQINSLRHQITGLRAKIPHIVPADLHFPGGFRLLHDQAAGAVSNTPPGSADTPIPAQTVADTMIENYQICRQNNARLEGLIAWVRTVHE